MVVGSQLSPCSASPSGTHCFCSIRSNGTYITGSGLATWNKPICCWCGKPRDPEHGPYKNPPFGWGQPISGGLNNQETVNCNQAVPPDPISQGIYREARERRTNKADDSYTPIHQ